MRHTAHFVRDSAVQTEPTVWVPVIAEQKFALQERRYITGKNRVFPVRAVREQCFFRDVILGACIVRTEKYLRSIKALK